MGLSEAKQDVLAHGEMAGNAGAVRRCRNGARAPGPSEFGTMTMQAAGMLRLAIFATTAE
jgi:hypothetical protein